MARNNRNVKLARNLVMMSEITAEIQLLIEQYGEQRVKEVLFKALEKDMKDMEENNGNISRD